MATEHLTGHMTHRFTIEASGDTTRVTHEVGFEPRGLARLTAPLMKPLLSRMVADLDRRLGSTLGALPPR
jgi:carbon monoxide dehydrogenase subunit G